MSKVIWEKTYYGYEDFGDYWRDSQEAADPVYNPKMKDLPGEFRGKMKVTITYEPDPKYPDPEK